MQVWRRAELKEMLKKCDKNSLTSARQALLMTSFNKKKSFHPNVLQEPFPNDFKTPKLELYDGSIDLNDHMNMFLSQLETQNLKDAFLCRVFPRTLKETPYHWSIDLPLASITIFVNLTFKFITQHIRNIRIRKNTNTLMYINQRNNCLCHYTQRFTKP